MRHRVAGYKLGRTTSHRTAMTRNMSASLIEHERIITTIQKAKHLKPIIEKLVTLSKEPTLHHRRRAFAALRNKEAVTKLFDVLGPHCATVQIKDFYLEDRFVVHISETIPGTGMMDIDTVLQRTAELDPEMYAVIEHLPVSQIGLAKTNLTERARALGLVD